jgi:hypothetical protein
LVWRVSDREIGWFVLPGGEYQRLARDEDGLLKTKSFRACGWMPQRLLRGGLQAVLKALDRGTDGPEHAEFRRCLNSPQ